MRVLPVLSSALLGAVLLAGCGGGGGGSTASSDAPMAAVGEAAPQPLPPDGDAPGPARDSAGVTPGEASGAGSAGVPGSTVTDLRAAPGAALIRTGELEVRVDDVRSAADSAAGITTAAGGQVESEDRGGSADQGTATLRLRVPPVAFDGVVADLAGLGDERARRLGTQDVTDQVVDLEARLATQRASVERVRALLAEATELGEVVTIEGEPTRRTADLESLQARLEALTAQVDLATIVLRLDSDEAGPVAGPALGFEDGLRSGWDAVTTTARVLAVAAGAALPLLPLVLVGGWLVLRARSRRAPSAGPAAP